MSNCRVVSVSFTSYGETQVLLDNPDQPGRVLELTCRSPEQLENMILVLGASFKPKALAALNVEIKRIRAEAAQTRDRLDELVAVLRRRGAERRRESTRSAPTLREAKTVGRRSSARKVNYSG